MALHLIRHPNEGKVLHALAKGGPLRFNEAKAATGLESTQVSRAMDRLVRKVYVEAKTAGGKRAELHYTITGRGREAVELLEDLHAWAHRKRKEAGRELDAELEAILA